MDLNPLATMSENLKFQNLEKHMDSISSDMNDIKSAMDGLKADMQILISENKRLVDSCSELNSRLSYAEFILKNLSKTDDKG